MRQCGNAAMRQCGNAGSAANAANAGMLHRATAPNGHDALQVPLHFVFSECSVPVAADARARMGQPYGSVPPAGEHTVPNAFERPGVHER
jgi:hypothetical protein